MNAQRGPKIATSSTRFRYRYTFDNESPGAEVRTYAPEFCDEEDVRSTHARIREAGGTLAYIADIRSHNEKVLEWHDLYEGEA